MCCTVCTRLGVDAQAAVPTFLGLSVTAAGR